MPNPRIRHDPLRDLRHLTARDRQLLELLAEHQVLCTAQIATALFPSLRAAQKRLTLLHRIGAVARFTWAHNPTDVAGGLRYTLGPLGDLIHPAPRGRRSLLAWRSELARNPKLNHLLGVNGFFTALAGVLLRSRGNDVEGGRIGGGQIARASRSNAAIIASGRGRSTSSS